MANDHEARVRDFLASAQIADPERYAAVCARYPVKSKRQLQRIAQTELTAGLQPMKLRRLSKEHHRAHSSDDRTGAPASYKYIVDLGETA